VIATALGTPWLQGLCVGLFVLVEDQNLGGLKPDLAPTRSRAGRNPCIGLSGRFPVVSRDLKVGELRARGGDLAFVV
jgi:hypothetical protein